MESDGTRQAASLKWGIIDPWLPLGCSFWNPTQSTSVYTGTLEFTVGNWSDIAKNAPRRGSTGPRAYWSELGELREFPLRNDGVTGSNPVCGTNWRYFSAQRAYTAVRISLVFSSAVLATAMYGSLINSCAMSSAWA
jgi:hypothetical protein